MSYTIYLRIFLGFVPTSLQDFASMRGQEGDAAHQGKVKKSRPWGFKSQVRDCGPRATVLYYRPFANRSAAGERELTRLITTSAEWIVTVAPIRDGLLIAMKR
jgi:hypothetical protein